MNGTIPPDGSYVGHSSCNLYTDHLGSGQDVLSYSYYTPHTINIPEDRHWFRYLGLVEDLLKTMVSLYPGWRMRIYHNVTTNQADELAFLCKLYCDYSYLDLCDVRQTPSLADHADLEDTVDMGRAWRFVVLGDPTVRMFGVRDLDSYLLERERDVVRDWVRRGDQFYVMRDTPIGRNSAGYFMPIKGGCWGGNNYKDFPLAKSIAMNDVKTRSIINPGYWDIYKKEYFCMYFDMVYLREIVWPVIRTGSASYDSYHCQAVKELGQSLPFPTKRQGGLYVGAGPIKFNLISEMAKHICPKVCRPRHHKDWLYC